MEQQVSGVNDAPKSNQNSTRNAARLGFALLAMIVLVGAVYFVITRNQLSTDKADIEAPTISIALAQGGTIQRILVSEGDMVPANASVAQVSDQILKTKTAGLVVNVQNNIGKTVGPNEPVVTLINPEELRVVAHIDENSGLNNIQPGQAVQFTVDAFGSKKYSGVVEMMSPTARQSGVVFNISDQREVKQFDVKIRFDIKAYPELKNGMSAKVTIYTK